MRADSSPNVQESSSEVLGAKLAKNGLLVSCGESEADTELVRATCGGMRARKGLKVSQ